MMASLPTSELIVRRPLSVACGSISARGGRENSDEAYVLDLCDEVLGEQGLQQHRFEWLLGDAGSAGRKTRLPVGGYWAEQRLIVEYRAMQHDKATPFFDKPGHLTVSESIEASSGHCTTRDAT
jgi:hypothetical protein